MTKHTTRGRPTDPLAAAPDLELDLMRGDRQTGWISGNRVGFVGFSDHLQAVQAAWVAHRAMMRRMAPIGTPPSDHRTTFALAWDGGKEVIFANGEPIAALVRPNSTGPSASESFGFEIRIPGHVDEVSVRATAYRMSLALRSSGIAWTTQPEKAAPTTLVHDAPSVSSDHTLASTGATTTTQTGGTSDVIDDTRPRARQLPPPQWSRRRRARARQRVERRVHRVREY